MESTAAVETAQKAVFLASAMGHLKNNRIEYLLVSILLYSVGIIDTALTYGSNVCL